MRVRRHADGVDPNSEIGAQLSALYNSVLDEGIPDKFMDLLEKLDEAEDRTSGRSART